MSLLLDALRRADESAQAPSPDREAVTSPVPVAPQSPSAPPTLTRTPPLQWRRLAVPATLSLALATLGAAAVWRWQLSALPASPEPPVAEAPTRGEVVAAAGTNGQPEAEGSQPPNAKQPPRPRANVHRMPKHAVAVKPPQLPAVASPGADQPPKTPLHPEAAGADTAQRSKPPAPAVVVRRGEPLEPPLMRAFAAWQAGRVQEAEHLYRQVLAADARQPDALLGLAAIAETRGDRTEAAAYYRRVLQLEPDHSIALAALAELSAGNDATAQESVLRQALARRPLEASLHTALGRLLAAQHRWSEAHQAFLSAWQLEPASADRAYDLAVALDRLRKTDAAAQMYAQALALAGPGVGFDADVARARAAALQASGGTEAR